MPQALSQRAEITTKVGELWEKVFTNSNEVLHQNSRFGFDGVKNGDPNIEERLFQLQVIGAALDILQASSVFGGLDYEQQRQILNAKQQITNMEMVAAAVAANQEGDYLKAVEALETQLPI